MQTTPTAIAPRANPSPILLIAFWLYVSIPLALGIWETLIKAGALFK